MLSKLKILLLIISALIIFAGVAFGIIQIFYPQNKTASKSLNSNISPRQTQNEKLSNVHKSPKKIVAYDLNNYESMNCDK